MTQKIEIEDYSEAGFWNKCTKYAKDIGLDLMDKALQLYFAYHSKNASAADKAIIIGALAYLISPIDVIPDITPVIGYSDDAGVIIAALASIASCIDDEVKAKAQSKLNKWFS